jgi:hypothetical protein
VGDYNFTRINRPMCAADRLLRHDSERTLRRGRGGEAKTVEHWGQVLGKMMVVGLVVMAEPGSCVWQRKLVISEIEALTRVYRPEATVVSLRGSSQTFWGCTLSVLTCDRCMRGLRRASISTGWLKRCSQASNGETSPLRLKPPWPGPP